MNLACLLEATWRRCPERRAIRAGETTLTYDELRRLVLRLAHKLRSEHEVAAGDVVAISAENGADYTVFFYALMVLRAVAVPIAPGLNPERVKDAFTFAGVRLLVAAPGASCPDPGPGGAGEQTVSTDVANLAEAPEVPAPAMKVLLAALDVTPSDSLAVILFTSGSTARPKGVMLSHANLFTNAVSAGRIMLSPTPGFSFGPTEASVRVVSPLPLSHCFGLTVVLNGSIAVGGMAVLLSRFERDALLQAIVENQATALVGVPSMYESLLHHPDLSELSSSLVRCVIGGDVALHAAAQQIQETMGCDLLVGYGLTETSPVSSVAHWCPELERYSIGYPIDGVRLRIADEQGRELPDGEEGEIQIVGPNLMLGYLNDPETTQRAMADGWFRSGDLGRRLANGEVEYLSRIKQMIVCNGYKVIPRFLESIIREQPGVAEVAVVGTPFPGVGEAITAYVVPRDGAELSIGDLNGHCHRRLHSHERPQIVRLVEELPRGDTGKISRTTLVEWELERRSPPVES